MKTRSTTILTVRHRGVVAMGGDGQVTVGNTIMKADAVKIRRLMDGKVMTGFAGATADAFALLERFEAKLKDFPANMPRAATELAKEWRTDRVLAAAGGDAGGGRRPAHAAGDRQRRRDPADRRRAGDRLGRELRRGGGPGAGGPLQPRRGGDRAARRWRSPRASTSTPTRTSWWRSWRARPDAPADRGGAGPAHRRPGRRQAGRGGRHPQPLAAAATCRATCARKSPRRTSS